MKKICSPKFILLFVTLPQTVLLALVVLGYGISNINDILLHIIIAAVFNIVFTVYAGINIKEQETDTKVFASISITYVFFIAVGIKLFNFSSFMTGYASPRLMFIVICMVSVLYGIFGIAYNTTSKEKDYNITGYIAGIIGIPFIWFITLNLINGVNFNTFVMILTIISIYTILLLITKLVLIQKMKKPEKDLTAPPTKNDYITTLIVMIIMPLGGLALNQGFAGFISNGESAGVFGDFSSPAYYVIALVNGFLMLIPPVEDRRLRLLLFYMKACGYTYILYFFIIFMPILPLGIVGVIFYGLGLFVFVPLAATICQGNHLLKEFKILSKEWRTERIIAVLCMGLITLPVCLTLNFWGDRGNFTNAVQYLGKGEVVNNRPVNLRRLKRTLNNIKGSAQLPGNRIGFMEGDTPIISAFYNYFVLGGKVISQENVLVLENLFFDAGNNLVDSQLSDPSVVSNDVRLIDAVSNTKYDEKNGVYRSWVDLTLKNTGAANGEYITSFKLPEGAYISDYYLDVAGERKEGILTDRRAALFIYRKIVNARRDPGLLHYIGKDTLELRVFPFGINETRQTGFEILHQQQFDFLIDGKSIPLGGEKEPKEVAAEGAVLLSPAQKAKLPSVKREPKYYFVIDCSENSNIQWLVEQAEDYAEANKIYDAGVAFVSYKMEMHSLKDMKEIHYKAECGFNLDMAVRSILSREDSNHFPVIIAVSDNMPGAVFPMHVYSLAAKFPESPYYYALNHNLTLKPYSYKDNKAQNSVEQPIVQPILDYNGIYVLDNGRSELVLTEMESDPFVSTGNQYKDALLLDAMGRRYDLDGKTDLLELVRGSFRARILTPHTAFIVVETAEQEKELFDMQEKLLNNHEEIPSVTLDEPPLLICMAILLLVFIMKKKKTGYISMNHKA